MKPTLLIATFVALATGGKAAYSEPSINLEKKANYPIVERYLNSLLEEKRNLERKAEALRIDAIMAEMAGVKHEIATVEKALVEGYEIHEVQRESRQKSFSYICGGTIPYDVHAGADVVDSDTHQAYSEARIYPWLGMPTYTFPVTINLTAGTILVSDGDNSNRDTEVKLIDHGSDVDPVFGVGADSGDHGPFQVEIPPGTGADCSVKGFARIIVPSHSTFCPGGAFVIAVDETPEVDCG